MWSTAGQVIRCKGIIQILFISFTLVVVFIVLYVVLDYGFFSILNFVWQTVIDDDQCLVLFFCDFGFWGFLLRFVWLLRNWKHQKEKVNLWLKCIKCSYKEQLASIEMMNLFVNYYQRPIGQCDFIEVAILFLIYVFLCMFVCVNWLNVSVL